MFCSINFPALKIDLSCRPFELHRLEFQVLTPYVCTSVLCMLRNFYLLYRSVCLHCLKDLSALFNVYVYV